MKSATIGWALTIGLGAAAFSAEAHAAVTVDPGKVQSLATALQGALGQAGCSATSDQDVAAIQSTIASSGATPFEAEAALDVVQSSSGLCPAASIAVASVNKSIELALASPAAGPGGGPGGSSPIGAPPAYVSGGGSNYLAP